MKPSARLAKRFKLTRGRPEKQDACPENPSLELTTKVASFPGVASTVETGPTMRWVGPETLVDMVLEGCEALALADSRSQVNTMTLEFVQERDYPVLPLSGLVDYPLHLVGLGGLMHMSLRIHDCKTSSERSDRV